MTMGCGKFSEAEWSGFLFGESSSRELLAHLDGCPRCREDARSLQSTVTALRAVPASHPAVQEVFTTRVLADVKAKRRQTGASGQQRGMRGLSRWSVGSLGTGSLAAAACLLVLLLVSGILGPDRLPPDDVQHGGENGVQLMMLDAGEEKISGAQIAADPESAGVNGSRSNGEASGRMASTAEPLSVPDGVSLPVTPMALAEADVSGPRAQPIRESFGITVALP